MRNQKVVLVTGASSGFGELTARLLAQSGFKVFGTSRRSGAIGGGVEMIELDVTLQASVEACIQTVLTRSDTIDVLVNNAGQTHASLVEDTPIETALRVFDTNFWGVVRVTNAVLPTMRKQRSGRIINVSSLAGLVGVPGQGFYAASKHALEGYTETLQSELQQFDIRVSLVEPGFFRTHLDHSMLRVSRGIPDYDIIRSKIESAVSEAISGGGDPRDVAQKIVVVARSRQPKLRYRVGSDATWVPRWKTWLPEGWFMAGMRRRFHLKSANLGRIERTRRIGESNAMASTLPPGELFALDALVTPTAQGIASRVLARTAAGNITLFAFDAGEELSEHTAPFDALVLTLSGALVLTIGGRDVQTTPQSVVLMPANVPHAVRATEPSQMLLIMLREREHERG